MTPEQAKALVSKLTYEQKIALNEMLKGLEQMRRPSESRPA